jgi:hypothetical protein
LAKLDTDGLVQDYRSKTVGTDHFVTKLAALIKGINRKNTQSVFLFYYFSWTIQMPAKLKNLEITEYTNYRKVYINYKISASSLSIS